MKPVCRTCGKVHEPRWRAKAIGIEKQFCLGQWVYAYGPSEDAARTALKEKTKDWYSLSPEIEVILLRN